MAFFKTNPAEFDVVVQLNTDLKEMPVEDASAPWSEEASPYRPVGKIILPPQDAYEPSRADVIEGRFFSPAHALAAHRPLGSIARARMAAYTAMSTLRRQENQQPLTEPAGIGEVPA